MTEKQLIVEVGSLQRGPMPLSAVKVLQLDVPNKNKRIYPAATGHDIVQQISMRNESLPFLGELQSPGTTPAGRVDLDQVSHEIKNVRIEGGFLVASIQLLKTPCGGILHQLMEGGIDISNNFRTRGEGTFTKGPDGTVIVSNYRLISIDFVQEPA